MERDGPVCVVLRASQLQAGTLEEGAFTGRVTAVRFVGEGQRVTVQTDAVPTLTVLLAKVWTVPA